MSDALRIALLGCGRIALGRHLRILAGLPDARVVAVIDPDAAARERATNIANGATPHATLDDLAPDAADAVVITSPTPLHAEHAEQAFSRGWHVYLEKPVGVCLDQADRVRQAWQASGRVGMIGFNYRFHPLAQRARQAVEAGELGQLIALRSVFASPGREHPGWKQRRESGGGAMLDLAIHHVDLFRFITDRPVTAVRGWLASRHTEHDTAGVELTLGEGLIGQITVAMNAVDDDRIDVIGEDAAINLDRVAADRALVRPRRRDGLRRLLAVHHAAAWATGLRPGHRHEVSTARALARFVAAARGQADASPDIEDGCEALRIVLAAEADAAQAISSRNAPAEATP